MTPEMRRAVRSRGLDCCCRLLLLSLLLTGALVLGWPFSFWAASAHSLLPLSDLYARARQTRIRAGHAAAQPLYADLLRQQQDNSNHPGKGDLTTATRLAASTGELLQCWQNACSCGCGWRADDGIPDRRPMDNKLRQLRAWFLDSQYTTRGVATALNIPVHQANSARAPIYVSPAAAGTVTHNNYPFPLLILLEHGSTATTAPPLQCLVALFLLGLAVPETVAHQACSSSNVQLLYDFGLVAPCDQDSTLLVAVVSIVPVDVTMPTTNTNQAAATAEEDTAACTDLHVVTDWHPRVLNTIQITDKEEAVMYIGPDSLALVQHWLMLHSNNAANKDDSDNATRTCWLDLCTGSGIQALVALALNKCQSMVCLDLNPRALRFTAFSAALNGLLDLSDHDNDKAVLTLVQGNLLDGTGRVVSFSGEGGGSSLVSSPRLPNLALVDLLRSLSESRSLTATNGAGYDMITANPPFLPVPSPLETTVTNPRDTDAASNDIIAARHGLFSAGGSSGEAVLGKILALSTRLLKPNGYTAIVSEFFFSPTTNDRNASDILLERLTSYWLETSSAPNTTSPAPAGCKALLFTNQYPISAQLYAERRADSLVEVTLWQEHLRRERIATCSPGLLYLQKTPEAQESVWQHVLVPKSERGSIWTPSNPEAVQFTQAISARFFQWRT